MYVKTNGSLDANKIRTTTLCPAVIEFDDTENNERELRLNIS
jgi:hypothetical protein